MVLLTYLLERQRQKGLKFEASLFYHDSGLARATHGINGRMNEHDKSKPLYSLMRLGLVVVASFSQLRPSLGNINFGIHLW